MSIIPMTANVHPMVRVGAAAHFMMPDKTWHRSETYPGVCLCGKNPMHATNVKPSVDDSWRYVPDHLWGACISKLAKYEEHAGPTFMSLKDGTTLTTGMRVVLDPEAALLYDQGTKAAWYVETIGRAASGDVAPIVKIRDKSTGVYAWSPVHWLTSWTEPPPAEPEPLPELAAAAMAASVDATVISGRMVMTITLSSSSDQGLVCFLCHRYQPACTHEFQHRVDGRRAFVGAHDECLRQVEGVLIHPE